MTGGAAGDGPAPGDALVVAATLDASAEVVFAALADPRTHAALDGTGWVRDLIEADPITASGQIFRMAMYHANHPDGHFEMANRVKDFDPPRTISWEPGEYAKDTGELKIGGWAFRYDLAAAERGGTRVRLTYDWSAVGPELRSRIPFPPFPPEHLTNSLANLARLCAGRT